MTSSTRYYTLTASMRLRLLRRGYSLLCYRCKKLIQIKQVIVAKGVGRHRRFCRYYHVACYEGLFI